MTKSAVGDWDTDPDANTDIADIPLAENQTYPRHVNNALREVMAQVATGIAGGAFASGGIPASLLTTRGDIIYRNATVPDRLAKGTAGQALKMGANDPVWSESREVLTAARTYYVRTDGSDSNTGLVDSSGGAFLTLQKAIDTVAALDISIYDATINVGSGTYAGATLKAPLGAGTCHLVGNTTTPSNCIIATTSADCLSFAQVGRWSVRGFQTQITTGSANSHVVVQSPGARLTVDNWIFAGSAVFAHALVRGGGYLKLLTYTVSGGAGSHLRCDNGGGGLLDLVGGTKTISGTPAWSTACIYVGGSGCHCVGYTAGFTGSATGVRYSAVLCGVIETAGGGASYFPGDSSGSTATGGQYN